MTKFSSTDDNSSPRAEDFASRADISKPGIQAGNRIAGQVQLNFTKLVRAGLNIYAQRDGESAYSLLAQVSSSEYIDARPPVENGQSEVRKYRAVYVVNGLEIGQWSDEIVIVCRSSG